MNYGENLLKALVVSLAVPIIMAVVLLGLVLAAISVLVVAIIVPPVTCLAALCGKDVVSLTFS